MASGVVSVASWAAWQIRSLRASERACRRRAAGASVGERRWGRGRGGRGQVLCFKRLSEPYRPGDHGVGQVQRTDRTAGRPLWHPTAPPAR